MLQNRKNIDKLSDFVSVFSLVIIILAGCRYLRSHTVPETGKMIQKSPLYQTLDDLEANVSEWNAPYPEILIDGNRFGRVFAVEMYQLLPSGLNLNSACQTLLTIIKGIGPSRAARIVQERDRNGHFTSPENFTERTGVDLSPYLDWIRTDVCRIEN